MYLLGNFSVVEYNPRIKSWRNLPRFQVADEINDKSYFSFCVIDSKLYVRSETESEVGPFQVLDLDEDDPQWKQLASPNEDHPTGNHGLFPCGVVAVDGSVYIMGGGGDTSVERYDAENDVWSIVSHMPNEPTGGFGIAALENKIFVSGGIVWLEGEFRPSRSVACFDTTTNTWSTVASLNRGRSSNHLHAINGSLVALGGDRVWGEDATAEYYNASDNVWTMREGNEKVYEIGCSYAVFMMMKCF